MSSGNDPCPQCGFKLITVDDLIALLEKVKNKKLPVWIAPTGRNEGAKPFSHVSERADDKHCVYLFPTAKHFD